MNRIITFAFLTLTFLGCNDRMARNELVSEDISLASTEKSSIVGGASAKTEDSEYMKSPPTINNRVEANTPSKIIYTADVKMQVDNLAKSYAAIRKAVADSQAYLASDNQSQSDYETTLDLTIRVPASRFDSLLHTLVSEGVFLQYKNIRAEDVTSQWVDVETRLKNKKELEARYLAILKQATKVSDILEVQTNLSNIREDIEAQEAQLKLLQDQVSYSTINLSIYQQLEYKARPKVSFFAQIVESLTNGGLHFKYFMLHVISLWPFAILVGLIVFGVKRWRTRKK